MISFSPFCTECGKDLVGITTHQFEEKNFCEDCFERIQNNTIKSYGDKHESIFCGSCNLFIGVDGRWTKELNATSNAEKLLDLANYEGDYLYVKHDGSTDDDFELVSHSMTFLQ